jgi:hypothetical protein
LYISELKVENVGPVRDFHCRFEATGIHWVPAPGGHGNGTGKTTLVGAIVQGLLGEIVNLGQSFHRGGRPSSIKLQLCSDETVADSHLSWDWDADPPGFRSSKWDAELFRALLPHYFGPEKPRLHVGGLRERFQRPLTEWEWRAFASAIQELELTTNRWHDRRFEDFIQKHGYPLSAGDEALLDFCLEWFVRRSENKSLPLILDNFYSCMDHMHRSFCREVLTDIAERSQVILFGNNRDNYILEEMERASASTLQLCDTWECWEFSSPGASASECVSEASIVGGNLLTTLGGLSVC